jgi:hypothetical protein
MAKCMHSPAKAAAANDAFANAATHLTFSHHDSSDDDSANRATAKASDHSGRVPNVTRIASARAKRDDALKFMIGAPARHAKNAAYAGYAETNPHTTIGDGYLALREVHRDMFDYDNDNPSASDHAFQGMMTARAHILGHLAMLPSRDLADAIIKIAAIQDMLLLDEHGDPDVRLLLTAVMSDLDRLHEAA